MEKQKARDVSDFNCHNKSDQSLYCPDYSEVLRTPKRRQIL